MKILVTGASGFIGSNIMAYLKYEGHTVFGCGRRHIDNSDGYIVCDLIKGMPDLEVDVIIHTAALSPSRGVTFNDYFNANVIATKNILEYAESNRVKRIIYTGSVSSFGNVKDVLNETSPHNAPDDYGLTKYVAEQLIKDSHIPYSILILPGVIGKGCRSNWLMKAAATICRNENFTYYNGHGYFNNVLDVGDLCRFVITLLRKNAGESETYLLGSREMMRIKEVVEYLKARFSSSSQIYEDSVRNGSFCLDINKALAAGFCSKPVIEILDEICIEVSERGER